MPYNDITKNLFYNSRMIISVDLSEPLAWRISKVEPFACRGNMLYTLKQDVLDKDHDYIPLWWGNYLLHQHAQYSRHHPHFHHQQLAWIFLLEYP